MREAELMKWEEEQKGNHDRVEHRCMEESPTETESAWHTEAVGNLINALTTHKSAVAAALKTDQEIRCDDWDRVREDDTKTSKAKKFCAYDCGEKKFWEHDLFSSIGEEYTAKRDTAASRGSAQSMDFAKVKIKCDKSSRLESSLSRLFNYEKCHGTT